MKIKFLLSVAALLCTASMYAQRPLGGGGSGGGGGSSSQPNPTAAHTFADATPWVFTHNLNTSYPVVTCWSSVSADTFGVVNTSTNTVTVTPASGATFPVTINCSANNGSGPTGATGGSGTSVLQSGVVTGSCATDNNQTYYWTSASGASYAIPTSPTTGCSIILQNNDGSNTLTISNASAQTVNGQTSALSIAVCGTPTTGCPTKRLSWDAVNSVWIFGNPNGAVGATGPTGPTGSGGLTVQSGNLGNLTGGSGARAMGTVYHNTLSVPLQVLFSCTPAVSSSNLEIYALTDSNSTPAAIVTIINNATLVTGQWLGVQFPVLAGNYYEIVNGANCSVAAGADGTIWYEFH